MNTELLTYWPTAESVAACMKIDAESASPAVFLAVHQPVTFERYEIGSQSSNLTRCGEQELLDALLKSNLSDGRVIIPLVGNSGAGKSHIVQWLYSKLEQLPDKASRVIIRIPKGKSLKGVLGLLLDKLDEPEYEQFREKLRKAQDELDADEAAGLLCEMLAYTLIENAQAVAPILQTNRNDREARTIQAYGDPKIMPTLLRNQRLRDLHFIRPADDDPGPIRRLVEQLTVSRDSSGEDDRKHQFVPEDLVFSNLPFDELGKAERDALNYLDRTERRVECAKVLNKALVDAKERLLGIDPTVTEMFDAVRKRLLEQGKELVLLVEDFAVLSGIQKQLLQVMIKEAVRDGQQILCTMRSVLAYTSGYLNTATVLTRAGTEYRISDEEGTDTEILDRIVQFVGAYLNAARIGETDLEAAYNDTSNEVVRISRRWLPDFAPDVNFETRKAIEKFNISSDGYPLFPFNRSAIRELSYEGCVRGDKLIFNPRYVIQNVLNRVLLTRDSFEANEFPSVEFNNPNRQLPARVSQAILPKVRPDDFERWLRFLRYWGGNPSAPEDLSFSPLTAKAFGLDPSTLPSSEKVQETANVKNDPVVPSRHANPTPAPVPVPASAPVRDSLETKWETELDAWRNGHRMGQNEAKNLRKLLANAVNKMINWDWELTKPLDDASNYFQHVFIPLAPGSEQFTEDGESTMFAVCTEQQRAGTTTGLAVVSALMAVIRYHLVHSDSWNYPGAEDDLPLYTAYLQPLTQRAKNFVIARYFKTPGPFDPAAVFVQGLLVGGRALGISEAGRERDYPTLINSLFANPLPQEQVPFASGTIAADQSPWEVFTRGLVSIRTMDNQPDSWTNHLLNFAGARQGGGSIVHAIDASRLKAALDSAVRTWDFDARIPDRGNDEFERFRRTYFDLRKLSASIEKEAAAYRAWHFSMKAWLDEDVDKELIVTRLKETVERAKIGGFASGLDSSGLQKLIDDFRGVRFKAALDDAARLKDSASRGLTLSVLGGGHRPAINASYVLVTKITAFLDEVEKRLATRSESLGADPKREALEALKHELSLLEIPLKEVCGV